MKYKYITFASWEERFNLGSENLISNNEISSILMFYTEDSPIDTTSNRINLSDLCEKNEIELISIPVKYAKPFKSWKIIREKILEFCSDASEITVDITTMPRNNILSIFQILEASSKKVIVKYHKPKAYGDWLTRNALNPSLVLKLSGNFEFGKPTYLIAITGFDIERIMQLKLAFSPSIIFLGIQTGEQFENIKRNVSAHRELNIEGNKFQQFDIDAYNLDNCYSAIENIVKMNVNKANIIIGSLGPKLSAISIYKIHKEYPQVGLCYTPSKDFNREYSEGYSETITGEL